MPRSPQRESGRIYEISVNHGTIVYVSKKELAHATFVLDRLLWFELACFAGLMTIRVHYKDKDL